jgi:CubicO group peptidase (beta-lactamase class C family)
VSHVDEVIAHLADTVPRAAAERGVPAVAIGLCDAERVLWAEGFGRGVGTDTMFSVQSTSKLYTATGVLLAVQEGLVDLDEPILRHLPGFTVRSDFEERPERLITLRHLLTHTAGFTHEAPVGSNYEVGDATFEEHLATIPQSWLRFPVGHHHEYSNLGIDLAGQVVAVASGEQFPEFMRRRLFEPLGLRRSTFDFGVFDADPDRVLGHSRTFERAGRQVPRRVPMVPSGGLYTSVGDVLRYVQLHLRQGEDVLRPELIRQHLDFPRLSEEQTEGYGLGLYVDRWAPGVRVLHHGGAGFGFLCQVFWLPGLGIGGAVLTSSVDHDLQNELAADIVRRLSDAAEDAPPARVVHPRPDDATGRYVGRLGDVVEVDAAGPADPGQAFLRDAGGHVRYLLETRAGDVRYRTVVPALGPSTLGPGLAGDYESRVGDVPMSPYRLRQDGDRAVIDLSRGGSLDDPITLQLTEVAPGRYLSATGEVLTTDGAGPAYANIPLHRRG